MAEVVGLLSLGLAAPELLATLYKAGVGIHNRIRAADLSDANLKAYYKLGSDISNGLIRTQLALVISSIHDELISESLKAQLDESFRSLLRAIIAADDEVDKMLKNKVKSKFKILLLGENVKLTNCVNVIEEQQLLFERLANYVNLYRAAPSPAKLESTTFCILGETDQGQPGDRIATSNVIVSPATHRVNNAVERISVLVESRKYHRRTQSAAESDVRTLVAKLQSTNTLSGIPECLGYRQSLFEDSFELIFKLPRHLKTRSLANLLSLEEMPPLEKRIVICRMLASAVSDVHTLKMVHKNIRPYSVLVLGDDPPTTTAGILLTDWSLVRGVYQASRWIGEDQWHRAIYQHPSRQGIHAEAQYSFRHDIYSLAVCMMEVLLWQSMVIYEDVNDRSNPTEFCEMFYTRAPAFAGNYSVPLEHLRDPERLSRYPHLISDIVMDIARTQLARVTGTRIATVILTALAQTSENEGNEANENPTQAEHDGIQYLNNVLLVLNSICV